MKKILIILGRYLPGYKDGGPIRSIANLTDHLGDEYDFYVLTADRDSGDKVPYPGIKTDDWNTVGKAKVMYACDGVFTKELILKSSEGMDMIYMCGCFNSYARLTLKLSKNKKISAPVIIAPMGLFSEGAFKIHYLKKKIYIEVMKACGLFKNVVWSVTSFLEAEDVRKVVSSKAITAVARDLPRKMEQPVYIPCTKEKGKLKVCFLSRIDTKKNLKYAIEILKEVKCELSFDIYGPIHDEKYWEECKKALSDAEYNWNYNGVVAAEGSIGVFAKYDLFLFPTMGENYGHVIVEALSAARPVVISNMTPWQDLEEQNAGISIALEDKEGFVAAIEKYAKMDQEQFETVCLSSQKYALNVLKADEAINQYREMFNKRINEQ